MNWKDFILAEMELDYYKKLTETLRAERERHIVYPPSSQVLAALKHCDYDKIKVFLLGQDPFHNPGEAHGLAFSVNKGIRIPPSLRNIYKELKSDLGIDSPNHGYLMDWCKQGVLLLNAALTVRENEPGSHQKIGWQEFTDKVIMKVNEKDSPVVFKLWGAFARQKKLLITNPKHLILESAHPSPFSANNGFFGSKPFSKTNDFLARHNITPIDWKIYE